MWHDSFMEIAHRAIMLKVLKTLNEAQARWYVAKEALALGVGSRGSKGDARVDRDVAPHDSKRNKRFKAKALAGRNGTTSPTGRGAQSYKGMLSALENVC